MGYLSHVRLRTCHAARVNAPAPGWYTDPHLPATLRWWDGSQWTEGTRPMPYAGVFRPRLGPGWARLSVAVQVLLVLCAACAVYSAITSRYAAGVYNRLAADPASVPYSEAARADSLVLWQLAELPLVLLCGILFITWLYRGHRSDHMEPLSLQHKSGWAIGGWFVPILNLWRPYQMVTDLRRGAAGTRHPLTYPVQALWWGAFLVYSALDRVVGRLLWDLEAIPQTDFAGYAEAFDTAAGWDVARSLMSVVTAVLAVVMVRRLTSEVLEEGGRRASAARTSAAGTSAAGTPAHPG